MPHLYIKSKTKNNSIRIVTNKKDSISRTLIIMNDDYFLISSTNSSADFGLLRFIEEVGY